MITASAHLKYAHIAPRKARAVARLVKGMGVREAQAELLVSPRRASVHLRKLIDSALANAIHNSKAPEANLFIKEIRVDTGPMLKRWMTRARGGSSMIQKKTSHISVSLALRDKTSREFALPKKRVKTGHQKSRRDENIKNSKEIGAPVKSSSGNKGVIKRLFRRKAV